jgi:hypothetical protein
MLIGNSSQKPSLKMVRSIKQALRQALGLPEDAMVTVTQLACLEEDCAPLETVVGVLRPGAPQLQHKIHKATNAVTADDLTRACKAWGHDVAITAIELSLKEN